MGAQGPSLKIDTTTSPKAQAVEGSYRRLACAGLRLARRTDYAESSSGWTAPASNKLPTAVTTPRTHSLSWHSAMPAPTPTEHHPQRSRHRSSSAPPRRRHHRRAGGSSRNIYRPQHQVTTTPRQAPVRPRLGTSDNIYKEKEPPAEEVCNQGGWQTPRAGEA